MIKNYLVINLLHLHQYQEKLKRVKKSVFVEVFVIHTEASLDCKAKSPVSTGH